MDDVKSKISKAHLTRRIFPEDDYQNLMVDLSQKHVSISGIGIFSVDYQFCFIVRPFLISLIFSTNFAHLLRNTLAGFNNHHIFSNCDGTGLAKIPQNMGYLIY